MNKLSVEQRVWAALSKDHAASDRQAAVQRGGRHALAAGNLQLGDDDEIRLHRDEAQLRKSGKISLGQAVNKDPTDVLYFQCAG